MKSSFEVNITDLAFDNAILDYTKLYRVESSVENYVHFNKMLTILSSKAVWSNLVTREAICIMQQTWRAARKIQKIMAMVTIKK
jgi:hypothetical protein